METFLEDDIPTEIAEIPFPQAQLPEFCLLQAEKKGKVKQPFALSSLCNRFVTTQPYLWREPHLHFLINVTCAESCERTVRRGEVTISDIWSENMIE